MCVCVYFLKLTNNHKYIYIYVNMYNVDNNKLNNEKKDKNTLFYFNKDLYNLNYKCHCKNNNKIKKNITISS